ncbi:FAD-dependent monooxygenase [Rhizobium sp. S163]|uniref:FAD-dependent monooxygenase n=1 Tax=Rhizobium sp. S163 TaxID=3055039 RepID=UPI0025A95303|nr:FAD-dependent monooxygenase [Rhizobium sp. S163]MDM9648696.1 FAD-dependent monooxygenase [Rhizobium sp. S163]
MKILIVGAGIGGLAAARAFEMQGFSPDIVERQSASPNAGHSIFLLGNAMRALRQLGLEHKVSSVAFPIQRQTITSPRGAVLNSVETQSIWADCGPCVTLRRQSLLDILRFSLSSSSIKYDMTVTHTLARAGKREVHFSDGSFEHYDLVIGADGIRSSLRAAEFPDSAPVALGLGAWRLLIDHQGSVTDWTAMLGSKLTLLGIPLTHSKLYIYADCPSDMFRCGSISRLRHLFKNFAGPVGSVVAGLNDETIAHRSLIEEVPLRDYIADHLVLIGDAAHASSPSMAQGAALAIEDAIVLSECVSRRPLLADALSSYQARRRERVSWVREQSHARDKLRSAPDFVRGLILRSVGTKLYRRSYSPLLESL